MASEEASALLGAGGDDARRAERRGGYLRATLAAFSVVGLVVVAAATVLGSGSGFGSRVHREGGGCEAPLEVIFASHHKTGTILARSVAARVTALGLWTDEIVQSDNGGLPCHGAADSAAAAAESCRDGGRGLHSSTFQLNLSRF